MDCQNHIVYNSDSNIKLRLDCPFCGKLHYLLVNEDSYSAYKKGDAIDKAFPDIDPFYCDMIRTGQCIDCSEKIFNKPDPSLPGKWGPMLGYCEVCGTPIYGRHNLDKDAKHYRCPICLTKYAYDNTTNRLIEIEQIGI